MSSSGKVVVANHLYHFFDIGQGATSRPVRRVEDVYIVEGLEMTFAGIMN